MNGISRRRFLEQSLLAAAAGMAAAGGAESVAAADPRVRRVMANDKIRIAVIGFNGRGMNHIDSYLGKSDVEIVALCDADEKVLNRGLAAVEKKSGKRPTGYQDIRKLLENGDVDAVSIATPNHWHSLAGIWAMQHGKDVYVEKPVSHNVREGRILVEVAHKTGKICQAGTQSRSNKACQDAMEYIHSGKIGKVTLSRGLCYKRRQSIGKVAGDQPVPEGVDYDLWLGPAPQKPVHRQRFHYDWHWFWDYGAGDLGNQGIHQMDIARWALNRDTLPNGVMSVGGRFGYVDDGETPNTELSFFDYGDAQLIFEVRGLKTDPYKGASIGNIVYGTDGYVVFTDSYGKAAAFDNAGNRVQDFTGGGDHFGNFLEAVRSRKREHLHAEITDGHLSSALCHLGNISYRLGSPQPFSTKSKAFGDNKEAYETFGRMEEHLAANGLTLSDTSYMVGPSLTINPHHETFEHNAKASALLTREYRSGFAVPAHA
ncbi:MAG TPA: Gfo/Idh/MocA family oxidoreductase [Chthonomonadaceae bacterium]|nr:Gfo/Idh/MocA family oxidoreductase [Chthonomonadaceae bacterium]